MLSGYSVKSVLLPIVLMEASFGAEGSLPHVCWQSEPARKLHNQVGYAFRRAAKLAKKAPCWKSGAFLAGQVTRWAKSLDLQLAANAHVVESARSSARPRVLVAHLSEETCVPQDEVASSGVETGAWDHVSDTARKPRRRPHRRARRSTKLREEDVTMRALAFEAATEFELEARGLPLSTMGVLATCF